MSAPIIPASDRAWMTAGAAGFLQTPCRMQRFGGTWSTISADGLLCWVRADSREQTIPGATRTQQMRRWRITLPDGQDVRRGDQILALGYAYGVDEVVDPTSNSIDTNVLAWALWTVDADGNPTGPPLYLSFNALVSTRRAGAVVLTDADAERVSQEVAYTPDGQVVNTVLKMIYPIDVIEGDSLTDSGYPAGIVRLVMPTPTGLPITTILVVRPLV